MKNYKVTNKKTGETITASFKTPPTQEDVKHIFDTRATHKRQREISDATEREGKDPTTWEGFKARAGELIYAPSEAIAPEVMAPEDVEKLPTGQRIKRLGQEVASGLLSPENIAVAAPAFTGPLGLAASSIVGGGQMLMNAPETVRQAYEHPSLETVGRAGVLGAGLVGAGAGAYTGMKGLKLPEVKAPAPTPVQRIKPKGLLADRNVIDAEFVEPTPFREPTQIPERVPMETPLVTAGGGQKQLEGTTDPNFQVTDPLEVDPRAGGESIVAGPSTEVGQGSLPITSERLQLEPSYAFHSKSNSQTLMSKRGRVKGKELQVINDILKRRGILPDESETFELEKPIEKPVEPKAKAASAAVEGPVDQFKKENITEINKDKVIEVQKPVPEGEVATTTTQEPEKIENNWLREQDTEVLKNMLPGSRGQLGREINAVLTERGELPGKGKVVKVEESGKQTVEEPPKVESPLAAKTKTLENETSDAKIEKVLGKPIAKSTATEIKAAMDIAYPEPLDEFTSKMEEQFDEVTKNSPQLAKIMDNIEKQMDYGNETRESIKEYVKNNKQLQSLDEETRKIVTQELIARNIKKVPEDQKALNAYTRALKKGEPKVSSPEAIIDENAQLNKEIVPEEEAPKLDEAAFARYNSLLEDVSILDKVESQHLKDIAQIGKDAGLDIDTVVQDIIDNTPRMANNVNRAYTAANKIFRKGEAGFGTVDFFLGRAAKKAKGTEVEAPINQAREQINFWEKYFTKPERVIGRMGEAGHKLEMAIEDAQYEADSLKGKVDVFAHEAFKGLTPREAGQRIAILKDGKEVPLTKGNMDKYVTWTDGSFKPKEGVQKIVRMRGSLSDVMLDNATPANEKIANSAKLFKQAMEILGEEGEASSVSIIGPGGKHIPFTKMGYESWPRSYTDGFFNSLEADPANWNKIAKEVAADKGITVDEAKTLLKNKKIYTDITSRGKQKQTFKQDSFVIDPESVYNHIDQFTGRIGMAKALGPEDVSGSLVKDELTKLMNEGWDSKFASDTILKLVGKEGRKDVPVKGEATLYKSITDLNNLRLMTSFVINNLGGATPLVARVGEVNTLKGLGAYLANMEVARRMSTLSGARKGGIIERGGNWSGRIMGIPMSERFIRTWADQSGRVTANQLVAHLNEVRPSSPEYIRAKKLFDSLLGKDTTETIARGVITPEEGMRAGWQLSKDAEGLINPATFPDVWQQATNNVWVNLAMQYKRMAAQSMGSLIESFRLNPARALRAILVTGPIIGEMIGDTGSALFGALAGAYTGEGATKAAIRDVQERGKSLSDAAKPFLQTKLGLTEPQSRIMARYIDDMNRGFALGLIGDLIYSNVYWGSKAAGEIVSGGLGPAYEFGYDVSKSIMNSGKDLIYNFIPQRVGSSIKRSEKETQKGGNGPIVRAPRL